MAGLPGPGMTVELASIAREFSLAGVVLFARNVEEPEQVADLSRAITDLGGDLPPWVAVDQEGGRVARFRRGFTIWPPMATLGRAGDPALARRFAAALAAELAAVGVTLDFAPVLDVLTNARNPAIGDRALGTRPGTVAELGTAIIETLQAAGIAACGKHFPGHGDTALDSHHDLPVVEHDPDRLRAVELEPFRAAIAAGVASIMTGHLLVPALDEERPATLSPRIVDGLLRAELGFDRLVFTDDMEMKAVTARIGVPEAAVQAVAAGCDAVLVCSGNPDLQHATLEALIHAVEEERLPYSRVEAAIAHQQRAREAFLPRVVPPGSFRERRHVLGCEAHQLVAAEMAQFA